MATRLYKVSVGEGEFSVLDGAGSAVVSDTVELTVECSATAIGGARAISKQETLEALEKIKNHIVKNNWPPV